jgi:Putative sensor
MSPQQAIGLRPPADDSRLVSYRNPLRLLFSASPWRAAGYLISYLVVSCFTFSVAVTAVTVAAVLAVTILAVPLLIGAAAAVRWSASIERGLLGQVLTDRVGVRYSEPDAAGLWARARATWRDPLMRRELGYLIGLWVPLYTLDTVVISVWATLLAGITLPLWYWAPRGDAGLGSISHTQVHGVVLGYFPHGATGSGSVGLYVDTLPKALLAAVIFAILFLAFSYVLVATARLHARTALGLLGPVTDPLQQAKDVLDGPGPLGPLTPAGG